MKTTDSQDVSRSRDLLGQLIKVAGSCESGEDLHNTAVGLFKPLADKPELIKRAAEAFNSNKSIHRLANATDETRGNDFVLLDPDRLMRDTAAIHTNSMVKQATATKTVNFKTVEKANPLQKIATGNAGMDIKNPYPVDFFSMETPAFKIESTPYAMKQAIENALNSSGETITKLSFAVDCAKMERETAFGTFLGQFSNLDKQARATAADYVIGAYKQYGVDLVERFNQHAPMHKTATATRFKTAPMIPDTGIYKTACDSLEANYSYERIHKIAQAGAYEIARTLKKLAGHYVLNKKAGVLGAAVLAAPLSKMLPAAAEVNEDSKAEIYNKVRTPNLQNILRELELKRNFFETYSDKYISTFTPQEALDAYNNAVQMLPPASRNHPSSNTQLIKSWMKEQLGRGGSPSAADADKILTAAKSLSRQDLDENPFLEED